MAIGALSALSIMKNNKRRSDTHKLDEQTKKNYIAARAYYKQKEENFQKFWNDRVTEKERQFNEQHELAVLKEINDRWTAIYNYVIAHFTIKDNLIKSYKPPQDQDITIRDEDTTFAKGLVEKYKSLSSKAKVNLYSSLGFDYESYISNLLNIYAGDKISALTHMLGVKASGYGLRHRNREIISDIIISTNLEEDRSDLAEKIEVEYSIKSRSDSLEKTINDKAFEAASDIYGIAAKDWMSKKGGYDKKFTQSARIRDEISNKFENSWFSKSTPRSWNQYYAMSTANLHISSRLIDLLGPANVLIMMGTGYSWMSEFINNRFFYMNLYYSDTDIFDSDEILNIHASKDGNIHIRMLNNNTSWETSSHLHGLLLPSKHSLNISVKHKKLKTLSASSGQSPKNIL